MLNTIRNRITVEWFCTLFNRHTTRARGMTSLDEFNFPITKISSSTSFFFIFLCSRSEQYHVSTSSQVSFTVLRTLLKQIYNLCEIQCTQAIYNICFISNDIHLVSLTLNTSRTSASHGIISSDKTSLLSREK